MINEIQYGKISSRKDLPDNKSIIKQPIDQKNNLFGSFLSNSPSNIEQRNRSKTEELKIPDIQMFNSNNTSIIKSVKV